jgi:hypothetical protein
MNNTDYKNQKKKFVLYIIGTFAVGVLMTYMGLKNRLPIKSKNVVTEPGVSNVKLIAGIVLLIASILFTVFLFWVDKKVKSLKK